MKEKNANIPNIQTELSKLKVLLRYNQEVANMYFNGAETMFSDPSDRRKLREQYLKMKDTIQPKKISNPEKYCFWFESIAEMESQFQIGLMEGDAYFKKVSKRFENSAAYDVFLDEYKSFRKKVLGEIEDDIYSKLAVSIKAADEYYLSRSSEIISIEEYNQIKRTFLIHVLQNKAAEDICEADSYYFDFASKYIPQNEYNRIKEPILTKELKTKLTKDFKEADEYYRSYARNIVSVQDYNGFKKHILLPRIELKMENSIEEAEGYYYAFCKDYVPFADYCKIKKVYVLKELQPLILSDISQADAYYASCAHTVVAISEYNQLKYPYLIQILLEKIKHGLSVADEFYTKVARGIVPSEEYERLKKPLYLSQLSAMLQTDYLGAEEYYHQNYSKIISGEEFLNVKKEFVAAWFRKQKQEKLYQGNIPDDDQITAIASISGNVLVTARAGSGKTATLINRVYFMIKHCRIAPSEILMLAFNKKAADEMRDRMKKLLSCSSGKEDVKTPFIMTFHALAYSLVQPKDRILYDDKTKAKIFSRLLQDKIIDEYLKKQNKNPLIAIKIRDTMMRYFKMDLDETRGLERDEFLKVKRSAQESLKGENVKSFGEKCIANFLFEHDIDYRYEQGFYWGDRIYRPDFTAYDKNPKSSKKGVIIEYFGLAGNLDYDEESELKREYWKKKPEWTLLEIFPEDIRQGEEKFGIWFKNLLEEHGIKSRRLSENEIWNRIRERAVDTFTATVKNFILRCKKLCISPEGLEKRLESYTPGDEAERLFLDLVSNFYRGYQSLIQKSGENDFDELMQKAAHLVNAKKTVFYQKANQGDLLNIKYISIDEFQDFSELFYRLIQAIRKTNPHIALFCVGDDWQAINGFAGSDLRFFDDFGAYFGEFKHLELVNNYRSDKRIVDIGNTLMRNLGTPGRVAPAGSKDAGRVYVCYMDQFRPTKAERDAYDKGCLLPMVRRITSDALKHDKEVGLLCRKSTLPISATINEDGMAINIGTVDAIAKHLDIAFSGADDHNIVSSTVHGFKGLEKETIIILDALDKSFPLIHPTWIFSRILGENEEEIKASEKRLFYVALTRAKNDLFIITEKDRKSEFLTSLLEDEEVIEIDWTDFPTDLRDDNLLIEIRNQPWRGIQPTHSIKDLLRENGFSWESKGKVWTKYVSKDQFCFDKLIAENWYESAHGIEVVVSDDQGNIVEHHIRD